jgi:uncharacterized protein DUF6492
MTKRSPGTVSLITPSHRGDLERCALSFESIDRHVKSFERHYVIVNDEDLEAFKPFHKGRRVVLPVSQFLPGWLHEFSLFRWRKRRYWWSFRAKPVSGWHIQQLVKIQAVSSLPEDRYCLIDSDITLFRDFDVSTIANPNTLPVHVYRNGVGDHRPNHLKWVEAAHRMLGLEDPVFPADDYIDQIIVWDKSIVNAMIARIEALSGREWAETLCRARNFSEYMIYGTFLSRESSMQELFTITTDSYCRTYWDKEILGKADILGMLESAAPHEIAICIQSFNPTPLSTIRESLKEFDARPAKMPQQLMIA